MDLYDLIKKLEELRKAEFGNSSKLVCVKDKYGYEFAISSICIVDNEVNINIE